MKQTATIKIFKFQSFSEMLKWLREDWKNRTIFYKNRNHELAVFLSYNEETGKHDIISNSNADTFNIVNDPYGQDPEVESLEEYFDKNDQPMDEMFAKDYILDEFTGEEYAPVGEAAEYDAVGVPAN